MKSKIIFKFKDMVSPWHLTGQTSVNDQVRVILSKIDHYTTLKQLKLLN